MISRASAAALIAMGLFGGLGSRSRKGYGSFNLTELKLVDEVLYKTPKDIEELKGGIESLFKDYGIKAYPDLPPYTAYSKYTRIDIADKGTDPMPC